MSALLVAALFGGVVGFAADRLSTRWPDHEEGGAGRPIGWRTAVLVLTGALAMAALLNRWEVDPEWFRALVVVVSFGVALLFLLATDLDQRLLPDLLTLPMIVVAAAVLLAGWNPMLAGKEFGIASALIAAIGAPVFLWVTDRLIGGDLGFGDIKLAVSIGLLCGISRLFAGFLVASIAFSAILVVLIVLRRLSLRTAVPFGPVLIGSAFIAMVLP